MTISSDISVNSEVESAITKQAYDIAILPYDAHFPGYLSTSFMQEHLSVCVPPDHELANYSSVTTADLNGFNFLLRSELGFWATMIFGRVCIPITDADVNVTFYLFLAKAHEKKLARLTAL